MAEQSGPVHRCQRVSGGRGSVESGMKKISKLLCTFCDMLWKKGNSLLRRKENVSFEGGW